MRQFGGFYGRISSSSAKLRKEPDMDSAGSAKLLEAKVQMKSMEVVLLPMARQVSELTLMHRASGHIHPPGHTMRARAVADTLDSLVAVAKQVTLESADKNLQAAMLTACDTAEAVGKRLIACTQSLSAKPSLRATDDLLATAGAVLRETMNILLIWDESDVRAIVTAGQWFLDRLLLVEGSQSQRGMVICFKGLADALFHLLSLVDKRLTELIYQEPREQLAMCLLSLKEAVPQLSAVMQDFILDKTSEEKRAKKLSVIQDVRDTIHALLVTVSGSGGTGERAPSEGTSTAAAGEDGEREGLFDYDEDNMAAQMEKVQHQLSGIQRYNLDEDFNLYLDAIIRNSMAVAQVSKETLRNVITGLCHQALAYHQKLLTVFQDMCQNPTSKDLKKVFDDIADVLSDKLIELDVAVGDSVINQAADVVVDASAPVDRLVEVASASLLHSPSGSSLNLDQEIEGFRRHSRQLTQVAVYAAESAPDAKSMKGLRNAASQIETLTPQVVAASRAINRDPASEAATRRMEELRREWAACVGSLTQLLDTVTDPRDYIMAAESHIKQDILKCRDSTKARNPAKLSHAITSLSGRAKRAAHVATNDASTSEDLNYKKPLLTAATQLDKDAEYMSSEGSKLLQDFDDRVQSRKFARSVNNVQEDVNDVKTLMLTPPQTTNVSMKEPTSTSTPISTSTSPGAGLRPMSGKRIVSSLATSKYTAANHNPSPRDTPPKAAKAESPRSASARSIDHTDRSSQQLPQARPDIPLIEEQTGREFKAKMDTDLSTGSSGAQPPHRMGRLFASDSTSSSPHLDGMPVKVVSERGTQPEEEEGDEEVDSRAAHRLARNPSYGEYDRGFTRSFTTGEVQTQTPVSKKRDTEIQTLMEREKREGRSSPNVKRLAAVASTVGSQELPRAKSQKTTRSTSTSNLYAHTHSETSLQTGADLWDMDSIVDPASPHAVFTAPVQRLVSAAVTGEPEGVQRQSRAALERLGRLAALADPLGGSRAALGGDEQMQALLECSEDLKQLLPVLVTQAEDVADNPQNLSSLDGLRDGAKEIGAAVQRYMDSLDAACLPWSQCAQRLIGSTANQRQMEAEIAQLKTLLEQMMSVAKATIDAGSVKMVTQNASDDSPLQEAIERVVQLSSDVQSQTTHFVSQIQSYHNRSVPPPALLEELQFGAARWASTIKLFLGQMDSITTPTGIPAETLILAGETGDSDLLTNQTVYVKSLSASLYDISKNATEDLKEDGLIQQLRTASSSVERLAGKLTDTAQMLADTRKNPQSLQYQRSAENGEILQRDWAAKVLLVQVHVDDLTADYSAVLDHMMSIAMAANDLDNEQEREECMAEFMEQSALLDENLNKLEESFVRLVRGLPRSLEIKGVSSSIDFLRKLNPYVFKSIRALSRDASAGALDHHLHLKRQWAARAVVLGVCLSRVSAIDMSVASTIFEALIQGRVVPDNVCVEEQEGDEEEEEEQGGRRDRVKKSPPVGDERGSDASLPEIMDDSSHSSDDFDAEEDYHVLPSVEARRGKFSWDFSADGDVLVTSDVVEDSPPPSRDSVRNAWEDTDRKKRGQENLTEEEEEEKKKDHELEANGDGDRGVPPGVKKTTRSMTLPSGVQMRYIASADKPRPSTIAGFSSWRSSAEINPTSNSIAAAALSLHEAVHSFEEGDNPLLFIARGMSEQMFQIAQYCRGRGDLKNQDDMIEAARSVAADGQKIAKFVAMIAKHCTDTNMRGNLEHYAEIIPATSKQLSIIAKVKAATPSDKSAELMLGKNAENLMKSVIEAVKAAESACVRGLKVPDNDEEKTAVELILRWKRKLNEHRYLETLYAPRSTRGLREVGKVKSDPSLAAIVTSDIKFGRSP